MQGVTQRHLHLNTKKCKEFDSYQDLGAACHILTHEDKAPHTWPWRAMKWSLRQVPGGDLALMV